MQGLKPPKPHIVGARLVAIDLLSSRAQREADKQRELADRSRSSGLARAMREASDPMHNIVQFKYYII